MASVGILGGTFNPPHRAHVALAAHALEVLRLDRVELMPARVAPHKAVDDPGVEHRYEMTRLAVANLQRVSVSRLELDREGMSYTVDTLRSLHACRPADQLTLLVGADMARSLGSWREPEALLELARVAVAPRGADERDAVTRELRGLGGAERMRFLSIAPMDISSSLVRERIAAGESVREMVPAEVAAYIAAHGLYAADPA